MESISIIQWFIISLCMVPCLAQNNGERICLMIPAKTVQCMQEMKTASGNTMFGQISCLQDLFWSLKPDRSLTASDLEFVRNLTSAMSGQPVKLRSQIGVPRKPDFLYPSSGYRKRKEYRLMSQTERTRFHETLRRMYKDGVIDIFSRIHASVMSSHYRGPSFLPWNRMFLIYFEEAMRRYDRDAYIPYWSSPMDNGMGNPANSVLWTSGYMGNGEGPVTSGPAAYWNTDQGILQRDYGRKSRLISTPQIHQLYSKCHLADISKPTASLQNDIEFLMAGPNNWVGGDMSAYEYAGYDPMFYMHRAYVDYIWHEFRERQRIRCSVEPSTDYPSVPTGSTHHKDAKMAVFQEFTNYDGIQNHWPDSWYGYDAEPTCTDCCPGCSNPPPIVCNQLENICVARSIWADGTIPSQTASQSPLLSLAVPRNKGTSYESIPSDGRTIFTAVQDALLYAQQQQQMNNRTVV